MNFKTYLNENIFGDDFDITKIRAQLKARGKMVSVKKKSKKSFIEIYHGFNQDPKFFNYEFDPIKSEQGLLWFTHKYIRVYNPIEYATGKGDYLLTIKLPTTLHCNVVTYENGESEEKIGDELRDMANPYENCRYYLDFDKLIELPQGWFFTYKHEKFIGTNKQFKANPGDITKNHSI